jgi:hypothetical protein
MRGIYLSIALGFLLGFALPARFWIVIGLAAAALIFALGCWALAMIIRGFVRGLRGEVK